jgi:hypothetical protein
VVQEGIEVEANRFGKKHSCFQCKAKFYDMNKASAVCPKCGTDQNNKTPQPELYVLTDDDLEEAVGRVFDDDQSLPGDLDLEVGGLDGDDSELPIMVDDDLGDEIDIDDDD